MLNEKDKAEMETLYHAVAGLKAFGKLRDFEMKQLANAIASQKPSPEAMRKASEAILSLNDECNRYLTLLTGFGDKLSLELELKSEKNGN